MPSAKLRDREPLRPNIVSSISPFLCAQHSFECLTLILERHSDQLQKWISEALCPQLQYDSSDAFDPELANKSPLSKGYIT